MTEPQETMLRPTIRAHLPQQTAECLENVVREIFELHLAEGVLEGDSFLLARGRCAYEELQTAVAALTEVEEAAGASSLSDAEDLVAGRVRAVLPTLRQALGTLGSAFARSEDDPE